MAAKRSASSAWARPWSARRKKRTSSGPSVPPSTSASTILTWQADTQAFSPPTENIRRQVFLQVHFGADYTTGEYGWTTELDEIKRSVAWQLENLQMDYIDFGFIHCLDEEADLRTYEKNGILRYLQDLQRQGVVRHLGLSSHAPRLANRMLDMRIIDMLMFSINPVYDLMPEGVVIDDLTNMETYQQRDWSGIHPVMKPFCGGQLLDAAQSPFKKALSKAQCIAYALDKPGVLTVLPGYGSEQELREVLSYFETTAQERDYAEAASFAAAATLGACVYCKHCHPCPAGLDIALINKYYDLAKLGDNLAREHYLTLEKTAQDCLSCGHCDSRCPFHVHQQERMQEILAYFGR